MTLKQSNKSLQYATIMLVTGQGHEEEGTPLRLLAVTQPGEKKKISCLGLNRGALVSYSGGSWVYSLQDNEPVKVRPYRDGDIQKGIIL